MKDLIVIGAGITGLSAGVRAAQKGLDCTIYEQAPGVGGLAATRNVDGFLFDASGHLLHPKDPSFIGVLRALLGGNLRRLDRKASIYSHGIYSPFPFQVNLRSLPDKVKQECLRGFVEAYYGNRDLPTKRYATFLDWIVAKLGTGIGRHFMIPYNTKLWTVPPEKLTCEWLSDYVPRPTLDDVFNGTFSGPGKAFGYNAEFYYPRRGGIQVLSEALAARAGNICLSERLVRLHPDERCAEFESGRSVSYGSLISTIPLNKIVGLMGRRTPDRIRQAGKELRHNSLLILNLGVKGRDLTDRHWAYIPERSFAPYRVGVYSNFSRSMAPPGTTSFYVEIAYRKDWGIDKIKTRDKAVRDVVRMGLIPRVRDIVAMHMLDVECGYVIYDRNWAKNRRSILRYLEARDVFSLGRYGRWEYSGMEEAFLQGRAGVDGLKR